MKPSNVRTCDVAYAISDSLALLEGIEVQSDDDKLAFATTWKSDEPDAIELVVATGEVFRITIERIY